MLLSSHLVTDMETIEYRQCSITSVLRAREMTGVKGSLPGHNLSSACRVQTVEGKPYSL